MTERSNIIIHSTICYVLAFMFTTIVHEFAHAFSGWLSNSEPIMHHNYVEHLAIENLTNSQKIGTALAGPLISLIQGFLMGGSFFRTQKRGLLQLFMLWAAVLGFNNFLGYVMTGPAFSIGDIGKAYDLIGTPMSLKILYSLLAAIGLLFVANRMTRPFLEFAYKKEWVTPEDNAPKFSFRIIIIPYIIGSVIITFLYLPFINIISIIYPIMSGMIFIYPWQNARIIKNIKLSDNPSIGQLSWKAFIILIMMICLFRFVLPKGVVF